MMAAAATLLDGDRVIRPRAARGKSSAACSHETRFDRGRDLVPKGIQTLDLGLTFEAPRTSPYNQRQLC